MAPAIAAALQIFGDIARAPRLQSTAWRIVEARRKPPVDQAAAIQAIPPVGTEGVLRCVAGAAMRRTLDQIGAAAPCVALWRIGFERGGDGEKQISAADD